MVALKRKNVGKDTIEYYYKPECRGSWGVVSMDLKTERISILSIAESDISTETSKSIYITGCAYKIYDYIETGVYPEEDFSYWG